MSSEPGTGPSQQAAAPRAGVPLQTRGAVQAGALYVARRVDAALLAAVQKGRWVVVLGPRCSGKSSLRVRTARALQAPVPPAEPVPDLPSAPCRCAMIEARSLHASSPAGGYLALCTALAAQLRLPAVSPFWQRYSDEPPAARFRRYLLEEVATAQLRTVVLIDDLDALQALPMELPELLGVLDEVHEAAAASVGELALVCFSSLPIERLGGSADRARWVDERFLLSDFTRRELSAFAPALAALVREAEPEAVNHWLDAVYAWTAGHPQLTQHVCQQLVARASSLAAALPPSPESPPGCATIDERVERLIRMLFLDQDDAVEEEPCLREMAQALTSSPQALPLLALYRRLLSGVPVTPDPLDALQRELRLGGLAADADDAAGTPRLRPRCRLVATLLGETWARELEVRLLLQDAIAREGAVDDRARPVPLLRGVPLKTAQAWARKHPEALSPPQVRVLLASLEAARSEAEAKHQATAATLQRELRDKGELRQAGGTGPTRPLPFAEQSPRGTSWSRVVMTAVGLLLCLVVLAGAHRRSVRLQQTAQEAAARAGRAEQALLTLQAARSPSASAAAPPAALRRPPPGPALPGPEARKPGPDSGKREPDSRKPEPDSRKLGPDSRKPGPDSRKPERPTALPKPSHAPSPRTGPARELATCPDPGRSAH